MSPIIEVLVAALVATASLAGAGLVPVALAEVAPRIEPRTRGLMRVPIAVALGLAAWYGTAAAVAAAGGFRADANFGSRVPTIGLGLLIPFVLGLLAIWRVPPIGRLLSEAAVQPMLIAIQSYRVVAGMVFLFLMGLHQLPALFAIPAGGGDFLIGLTALGAASSFRNGHFARVVTWNVLGILDLVVAIGLGMTTAPGPVHLITTSPSTLAMSLSPLVLVPTFLVPLSVLLHVVSLRFLRGEARQARPRFRQADAIRFDVL